MTYKLRQQWDKTHCSRRPWIFAAISTFCLISIGPLSTTGVESFDYDDYGPGGGGDPYSDPYGGPGAYDSDDPDAREDMMNDIQNQRSGYPDELSTKKKKFKLFEKRRLSHEKAKAFCKKREGQLAQAMDVDEMQRLQMLLMKGTMLSTSVWVGADKREWKKHSNKMQGFRPNLPEGAMMMGGRPTNMCPAMSMSSRSLAPVECHQEFAFICEFPPGKGKAPPKKEKKKIKKDEMRRKRGISLFQEGSNRQPPSSTDSSMSEVTEEAEDKGGFNRTTTESAEATKMTESVMDFKQGHSRSQLPSKNDGGGRSDDQFTTNSLESESNSVDNATFIDPDQELINEFDEQIENMRRIVSPDSSVDGSASSTNGLETQSTTENRDAFVTKNITRTNIENSSTSQFGIEVTENSLETNTNHGHETSTSNQNDTAIYEDTDSGSSTFIYVTSEEPVTSEHEDRDPESGISIGTSKVILTNEVADDTDRNNGFYVLQNRSTSSHNVENSAEINFDGIRVLNRLVAT